MDLKKILALAMVALLALPSLTMVVRADDPDPEDGAGLAGAIERAQTYLGKVKAMADNMDEEYPDNVKIQGYLDEIYGLLGRYEYESEGPEIHYQTGTDGTATAELSEVESHSRTHSVHLETTGDVKAGDEARIVIPMPEGFTLGDLKKLSWQEYLVTGYPPHVDVILDLDNDGNYDNDDDALVFEYAYNYESHALEEAPMPYGAMMDAWYATFSDDTNGPAVITDTSMAWATKGAPGPLGLEFGEENFFFLSLAAWKAGVTYTASGQITKTINSDSIVLRLEIEVDNCVVQTEAYVDDIEIKGVKLKGFIYDFEEEHEELGAEAFLDQASTYFDEGEFNLAARNLAAARSILGRVKGLLNSMAKAHKVARTERFNQKFERRIQGIRDKIERPKGPKPK